MVELQNNILRTVFEIDFFSKEKNHEMQDRISTLFKLKISPLIDELFWEYSTIGETIEIEKLVVETGKLTYQNIETELPLRIIQAMRIELDKLWLKKHPTTKEYKTSNTLSYYTESLEYYLNNGSLRWQDNTNNLKPELLLSELILGDVAYLIKFLKRVGKKEHVRKRIAYQFSEPIILKIIDLIEPANSNLIIEYVSEFESLNKNEKVQDAETGELKKAKFLFVLTYLFLERGTFFNLKSFVKSLIRQMAAHYNMSFNELLFILTRSVRNLMFNARNYRLYNIVRDIFIEENPLNPDIATLVLDEEEFLNDSVFDKMADEYLYYFLKNGALPLKAKKLSLKNLENLFHAILNSRFNSFSHFIKGTEIKVITKNIVRFFGEQVMNDLISKFQPLQFNWILSSEEILLKLQQQNSFIILPDTSHFKLDLQEAIVYNSITSSTPLFNKALFIQNIIGYLALKNGYPSETIYANTRKALILNGNKEFIQLFNKKVKSLSKLSNDFDSNDSESAIVDNKNTTDKELMALKYFLLFGKLPWWNEDNSEENIKLFWNKHLTIHRNKELVGFIKNKILQPKIRKNIMLLFDELLPAEFHQFNLKRKKQKQPLNWLLVKNKLKPRTNSAVTEVFLLYSFLKRNLREEIMRFEIQKIISSYGIGIKSFNEEILQLAEILPTLYFDDFFSTLLANIVEDEIPTQSKSKSDDNKSKSQQYISDQKHSTVDEENAKDTDSIDFEKFPAIENRESNFLRLKNDQTNSKQNENYPTLKTILHYLQTGVIQANLKSEYEFHFLRILEELNLKSDPLDVNIFYLLLKNKTGMSRFFALLNAKKLNEITKKIYAREYFYLKNYISDFHVIFSTNRINIKFKIELIQLSKITFAFLADEHGKGFQLNDYIRYMMKHLFKGPSEINVFNSLVKISLLKNEFRLRTALPSLIETSILSEKRNDKKREKENEANENAEKENRNDAIFIENAGLILLWPFFSFFFETLGLIKNNKFISDESASRAAYLIEFLVTGIEVNPEHKMVLNKLLCNLPHKFLLSSPIALTSQEKSLSNELLTIAISRWPALMNTSIEGFRNSFLKREGKLELRDDKNSLTIKQASYDMLLDKISWSISIIKLPWMKNTLYIKWR